MEKGVCNDRKKCGATDCPWMGRDYFNKDGSGRWAREAVQECMHPAKRCHWDGTINERNSTDFPRYISKFKTSKEKSNLTANTAKELVKGDGKTKTGKKP